MLLITEVEYNIWLSDAKDNTLSRQSAHMAAGLSDLRTCGNLLPRSIIFLLLVLISVRR
jgi:hypothetical protein